MTRKFGPIIPNQAHHMVTQFLILTTHSVFCLFVVKRITPSNVPNWNVDKVEVIYLLIDMFSKELRVEETG